VGHGVISGIIDVLQSGMRWRDCPKEYGPSTTIYNRWQRWSQQGLRQRMFNELSQIVGTHYENAIDSTAIKVHRSARGKRGPRPGPGHKPRRLHNQSPRGDRPQGRPLRFLLAGGQCFDGKAAVPLLKPLPPPKKLLADKAYDCASFRELAVPARHHAGHSQQNQSPQTLSS
jgi:transposase